MSLGTPEKTRILQRKLSCKAKAQPAFRFYGLHDKICRNDILRHAYGLARANAGASGVDGMSFEQIEAQGLEAWLAGLREELVSKTYRPDPVRRVMIPKPDGGERASARHSDVGGIMHLMQSALGMPDAGGRNWQSRSGGGDPRRHRS
jgi:RNA-directed DNA polymerase